MIYVATFLADIFNFSPFFRYLRSAHYKDFLEGSRKKSVKTFALPKLSSAKQNIMNAKEQIKDGLAINSFV